MKKIALVLLAACLSLNIVAQLPNTDIWLLDIKYTEGRFEFFEYGNITSQKGYDNQPCFAPEGEFLLYSTSPDGQQTDIYKYDLETRNTFKLTKTSTSEYSPTVMPDRKNISVVMVEKDSTQRLWQTNKEVEKLTLLMENIDSIGYYKWLTKDLIAVYKITSPNTLLKVDVNTQKEELVAKDIGKCMLVDKKLLYFTQKNAQGENQIFNYNPVDGTIKNTNTSIKSEDFVIYNNIIIYGISSKLYKVKMNTNVHTEIQNVSRFGIQNISRLALSPNKETIAIVANDPE